MNSNAPILNPMEEAKQFLKTNPKETEMTASRLFYVNVKTLTSSIRRCSGVKNGGQNQILRDHETKGINGYIQSLLVQGILPTHQIVFNANVSLKKAHNPLDVGPSRRLFRDRCVMIYLETSHRDTRNEYNKDEEGKRQRTTRTCTYISSTALVQIGSRKSANTSLNFPSSKFPPYFTPPFLHQFSSDQRNAF